MSASLVDHPSVPTSTRGRRPRVLLGLVVLVLVAFALGCGDDGGTSSGNANSDATADLPKVADSEYQDMTGKAEVVIEARDNSFGPQYVTVSPGTKVTFSNRGRNPHNVIPVQEGAFKEVPTDQLQPGKSAVVSFPDAGDYPYYCSLHATPSRGMTGRIRVAAE